METLVPALLPRAPGCVEPAESAPGLLSATFSLHLVEDTVAMDALPGDIDVDSNRTPI